MISIFVVIVLLHQMLYITIVIIQFFFVIRAKQSCVHFKIAHRLLEIHIVISDFKVFTSKAKLKKDISDFLLISAVKKNIKICHLSQPDGRV